jgi:hypothetical protein
MSCDSLQRNRRKANTLFDLRSERELERDLHEPGRGGLDNFAELSAGKVAIDSLGPKELSTVESVESFEPELQRL